MMYKQEHWLLYNMATYFLEDDADNIYVFILFYFIIIFNFIYLFILFHYYFQFYLFIYLFCEMRKWKNQNSANSLIIIRAQLFKANDVVS